MIVEDHAHATFDTVPLLVLDMYEHAYQQDFGANAAAYIDAFLRNIDWRRVNDRLLAARGEPVQAVADPRPSMSVEELAADLARGDRIQVIDARPRHYYSRTPELMRGATWRDPDAIAQWSKELDPSAPVAVYCAYGFAVGCDVASALRERGLDARYVRGGLAAWYAAGGERMLREAVVDGPRGEPQRASGQD
jgi:superoxide dismutase, Fe-Mn family